MRVTGAAHNWSQDTWGISRGSSPGPVAQGPPRRPLGTLLLGEPAHWVPPRGALSRFSMQVFHTFGRTRGWASTMAVAISPPAHLGRG